MQSPSSDPRTVLLDETDEDEAELKVLTDKPVCFLIVGKPGSGKSSLASRLAQAWKCVLVDVKSSIRRAIKCKTELGLKCERYLREGKAVEGRMAMDVLWEHLQSPEVMHHGYVLECVPTIDDDWKPHEVQMQMIKSLPMKPDLFIDLKIADVDLIRRKSGQMVDPNTGDVFVKSVYQPDLTKKKAATSDKEEGQGEEGDEEEDDEDEEDEDGEDGKGDVLEDPAAYVISSLPEDVVARLVPRPEDQTVMVENELRIYNEFVLPRLEALFDDIHPSEVLELSASLPESDVYKSLMAVLSTYNLPRAYTIHRLSDAGDADDPENLADLEGEDPAAIDGDDMLRSLSTSLAPGPGYRWKRSRWSRYCPVELSCGKLALGRPELSVSFLSKIYCLSSVKAFTQFRNNPRPYLLQPMPKPPCKVAILGGPLAGKSSLCKMLAQHYKAAVVEPEGLIGPKMEKTHRQKIDEVREEALVTAIETVRVNIMTSNVEGQDEDEKQALADLVSADHPDVQAQVNEAVQAAEVHPPEASGEMYVEAIEDMLKHLEERRKEEDPTAPSGGWVMDGFPFLREHWLAIEEKENALCKPDVIVLLTDNSKDGLGLMNRWKELYPEDTKQMPAAASQKPAGEKVEGAAVEKEGQQDAPKAQVMELAPRFAALKEKRISHDNNMTSLVSLMRSSGLEPMEVDLNGTLEDMIAKIVATMEEQLAFVCEEFNQQDEQDEEDDAAAMVEANQADNGGGEEGEEDEEGDPLEGRRNWGDTRHYCPLSLHLDNLLRPGTAEFAAKYRGHVYYLGSAEYQEQFMANPTAFLPAKGIAKAPPLRLVTIGPKGSGKTLQGRQLAKELGVYHIDFRQRLQEILMRMTKYPVGRDVDDITVAEVVREEKAAENEAEAQYQEERLAAIAEREEEDDRKEKMREGIIEGSEEAAGEESAAASFTRDGSASQVTTGGGRERESSAADISDEPAKEIEFSEYEESIRSYLVDDDPLPDGLLSKLLGVYWNREPYKSAGFILEGFPRTSDDVRLMTEAGLFVDVVLSLGLEEEHAVKRLLPDRLARWKEKMRLRLERRKAQRVRRKKEKEDDRNKAIEKRKKEFWDLKAEEQEQREEERAARRAEMDPEDEDEMSEEEQEDEEDAEEQLAEIIAEEFPEEEEEEEEDDDEALEDAEERMTTTISEYLEAEQGRVEGVVETLDDVIIPHVDVNANRRPHVVKYQVRKALEKWVDRRESLLARAVPVDSVSAQHMLETGYKLHSGIGRWCPIKILEGSPVMPAGPLFPVIYRHHIYFCSSPEAREKFIGHPLKYLAKCKPVHPVAVQMAIVGPPKTGKTLVAKHFEKVFGCLRLSMGEALRWVLENMPHIDLAEQIERHLRSGLPVPEPLAIQALEILLRSSQVKQRGYVMDGFPNTIEYAELLTKHRIWPLRIIELTVEEDEMLLRGEVERTKHPAGAKQVRHDSANLLGVRMGTYHLQMGKVRDYYQKKYRNWEVLDAKRSRWSLRNECQAIGEKMIRHVQDYWADLFSTKAAGVGGLCVPDDEFAARVAKEVLCYCPVCWHGGELFDCATLANHMEHVVVLHRQYYCTCGEEHRRLFQDSPDTYFPLREPLPPPHQRPHRITNAEVKAMFPKQYEMHAFCPVTYVESGKNRDTGLKRGDVDLVVEFDDKIYCFASGECLNKFLRTPHRYAYVKIPRKLPPVKQPMPLSAMPNMGYLEQTVSEAVTKAIADVGWFRPKFPFLTPERSTLLYVAFHLKANNPRSQPFRRTYYKEKLEKFMEDCRLVDDLLKKMSSHFTPPQARPIDFDHKMKRFLQHKKNKITTR